MKILKRGLRKHVMHYKYGLKGHSPIRYFFHDNIRNIRCAIKYRKDEKMDMKKIIRYSLLYTYKNAKRKGWA